MTWYQILALCTCAPHALLLFANFLQALFKKTRRDYTIDDAILMFVCTTLLILAFVGFR